MKTMLVLGGSSDMGMAIARTFAKKKFSICLAGRDVSYLDRIARDIAIRTGVQTSTALFDACDFSSHRSFYESLDARPDVCLCVFGYLGDHQKAITDWREAERVIDTNYKGAVSILSHIANDFVNAHRGTIIGVSSVAGDRGRQSNYIYGSSKAGFTAFLSGLRNRVHGSGVHVLTVKAGFVRSKMTEDLELPRYLTCEPGDVATAVDRAYGGRRNVIYVPAFWRYIMLIIKCLPESIFMRLHL